MGHSINQNIGTIDSGELSLLEILSSDNPKVYLDKLVEECLNESGFGSYIGELIKLSSISHSDTTKLEGLFDFSIRSKKYTGITTNNNLFFMNAYMNLKDSIIDLEEPIDKFFKMYEALIKKTKCDFQSRIEDESKYMYTYNKNLLDLKEIVLKTIPEARIFHNYGNEFVIVNIESVNIRIDVLDMYRERSEDRVQISDGSITIYNFSSESITKDLEQLSELVSKLRLINLYQDGTNDPSYYSGDEVEEEELEDVVFNLLPGNKVGNYATANLLYEVEHDDINIRAFYCDSCYFIIFGENDEYLIYTDDFKLLKEVEALSESPEAKADELYKYLKENL